MDATLAADVAVGVLDGEFVALPGASDMDVAGVVFAVMEAVGFDGKAGGGGVPVGFEPDGECPWRFGEVFPDFDGNGERSAAGDTDGGGVVVRLCGVEGEWGRWGGGGGGGEVVDVAHAVPEEGVGKLAGTVGVETGVADEIGGDGVGHGRGGDAGRDTEGIERKADGMRRGRDAVGSG
ncbi:hypothetical protein Ga0100230_012020 [Opitutaceae bacterium TAV3]|nr:hypothetical protein Ga0100230_012020 [Opitutaceae bacterium TAV3]